MNIHSGVSSKSDKRERILAAALGLFVEKGFHGTTVPEVAQTAEVGAGTIYRYFESKEALVNELYRIWKQRLATALMLDFSFDQPARAQFADYWRRYVTFARVNPRAQAFLELLHHASYLDEKSRMLEAQLEGTARAVVGQMQAQRAVKDAPVEVLLAVVLGAQLGLIKAAFLGHLELTDEVVDLAEKCCWEAIRA